MKQPAASARHTKLYALCSGRQEIDLRNGASWPRLHPACMGAVAVIPPVLPMIHAMMPLSRPHVLRLLWIAVLLASSAGMYTPGVAHAQTLPPAGAISEEVSAASATPVDIGAVLSAGTQAVVEGEAQAVRCGDETPYPCVEVGAAGASRNCAFFGLTCPAPELPAWALIGRIDNGPWKVVGDRATFAGPGRLLLQYNDQDFGDNSGEFAVRYELLTPNAGGLVVTSITSSPATVGPGAARVPYSAIPAFRPFGYATEDTLLSTPLRSSPLRSSPLRSSPLRSSPLRSSPLRSSPLRSSELGPISLASVPLRSSSWQELLAGTRLDAPPAAVTLDQVFALDPLPAGIAALTLADVDLARTPLRSSSLGALLLGTVPLTKLINPATGDHNWCPALYASEGCDLTGKTLLSLERAGGYVDLPQLLIGGEGVDISGSPLAAIRLSDIELRGAALGYDLDAFETVGELAASVPSDERSVLYLGEVIGGLVATKELPFEDADLFSLLDSAPVDPADRVTFAITTQVPCDAASHDLDFEIPYGAHYVAGSARTTYLGADHPLNDPYTGEGNPPPGSEFSIRVTDAAGICASPASAPFTAITTIQVDPPPRLGPLQIEVLARVPGNAYAKSGGSTEVIDRRDAGATEATAATLAADTLQTGYVNTTTSDVDTYRLIAPPVGSTVSVVLSQLPADFDVTVTGPATGIQVAPLRSSPLRSSPLRSSQIGDDLYAGASAGTPRPAILQDLPLRSSDLATSPLRSSSITRGLETETATFTVTADDAGKPFFITVSGYNGASSNEPYVLRTNVTAPPVAPQCRARRSLTGGRPGAFPTLPLAASTKTLFLVNEQRLAQLYPGADIAALRARLDTIAARPEVGGIVVPVESDPTLPVDSAYAAWDAEPCAESAANAVATRVRQVLGHVSANLNGLKSVVLIGGDEVVPQGRVQDLTSVANETEEAGGLVFGGQDGALSRSLRDGYLLTDDVYGDFAPQAATGGQTFVPDVALGRLIETPAEILGQLDAYAAADGALSVSSAQVAGYDFLTDGAQAIVSKLRAIPGLEPGTNIDERWTADDAIAALNRRAPGISSINGHYDHYRGMPASAFSGLVPNLFSAGEISPAAASLIFTAGCHAGLSVTDVGQPGAGPVDTDRLLDWPQKIARSGGAYIANTTYGYGDTEAVAYTERLLELLSDGIASQRVTAGQALMLAKQRYAAEQETPGVYDRKASMGLTYYGLPFFKVGPSGGEGAAVLPVATSGSAAVQSSAFDVSPTFALKGNADTGQYYTASGEAPQITHHRPIQPRVTLDVTPDDGAAVHGAVVEALVDERHAFFKPVISQPVIDHSDTADETPSFRGVFPVSLQRSARAGSAAGLRDLLVLAAGQFTDESSTQTLFTRIAGKVLRSGSTDFDPPTMTNVEARVAGGTGTVQAVATTGDVVRGVALVRLDDSATWRLVELSGSGQRWTGTLPVGSGRTITYVVQLVDAAGNVGVSTNKGPGFAAVPAFAPILPAPPVPPSTPPPTTPAPTTPAPTTPAPTTPAPTTPAPPAPVFTTSPTVPGSGWFRGAPTLTLSAPGRPGVTFTILIDDCPPVRYTGPFKVYENGRHTVVARGSDGSSVTKVIQTDFLAPVIKYTVTPAPSAEGFVPGPAKVAWQCSDAHSGVATCPSAVTTLSSEVAGTVLTSPAATDVAGNASTAKTLPLSIDIKAPTGAIDALKSLRTIKVGSATVKVVSGTSADTLAGIRSVALTYTSTTSPVRTTTVAATVTCAATNRRSCTWTATLPAKGVWKVAGKLTDRAGRVTTVSRSDTLTVS